MRRSPFKFLDAYTRDDAGVFFGRDDEVQTLYDAINKNRLVLVYGTSGTGKSSLIQCGLNARFDATDWLPFFVRRGEDINRSLRQALGKNPAFAQKPFDTLPEALDRLGARYLRPVYLIFDQFEELLISGAAEERQRFITALQEILNYNGESSCHVLLVLREEYLASLYEVEKAIPGLFDRRLRVEPMRSDKLGEVITRSCQAFNIALENPSENVRQILHNLGAGKSGVALPYLQVYLDMLYQEDFAREYPGGQAPGDKRYPPLTFTSREIEEFGEIGNVLEKFLDNVEQTMRPELKKRQWPEDTLPRLLDVFVTDEGTKRPVYFDRGPDQAIVPREKSARERLDALPAGAANFLLTELERNRLLRLQDDVIELAHDSLAAVLDKRRTDEQRRLNEARQRIRNAWMDHRQSGEFLSRRQLNSLEPLLPQLQLDEAQQKFVDESLAQATRKERATRRRTIAVVACLTIASLVSIGLYLQASEQKKIALENQKSAVDNLNKFLQTEAKNVKKETGERLLRATRIRAQYPAVSDSIRGYVQQVLEKYPENPDLANYLDSLKQTWKAQR